MKKYRRDVAQRLRKASPRERRLYWAARRDRLGTALNFANITF